MKSIFFTHFLFLLLPLSLYSQGIFDLLGGSSTKNPDDFYKNASPAAVELVRKSFHGLTLDKIRDYHTHVVGINEKENGAFVNPSLLSVLHTKEYIRFRIYLSALKVKNLERADQEMIERLIHLIRSMEGHGKHYILAMDKYYNEDGTANLSKTEFYVPNEYIYKLHQLNPDLFIPVISVHPYRKDAVEELERWGKKGVKIVKWLPYAQGMNPANPALLPFYKKMIEYKMVLLSHAGEEQAVEAKDDQQMGNPLLLRYPLSLGVKVIVAHCASLGKSIDLESKDHKMVDSFDLFMRMMDDPSYKGLLFGDISATVQFNRESKIIKTLLVRKDIHARLLQGSDYPLPAVNLVIRLKVLEEAGFITKKEAALLKEIYHYNPLLFEFVLKRSLRFEGHGFSDSIFMQNPLLP